eukprot:CAMPEP_0183307984 /NCGR_PEP_ID=MMETSP0160_2-20130417/19675_1 /TAXON_ID=2839 ORGANISM="Odontella Sinensis, Strain Grunow 1884" /NCGR_SAMPLE_ID=MMETSP0160_2 /ASSEMBLY_ACC=CAM_ASM_000250 /LENGTH=363 /DNA_ID=CAMNT_0025471717 /DNA_START=79 /DNA_END=1170 /DNA_ORIENTATION=-
MSEGGGTKHAIAVIGAGLSGLSAADLLCRNIPPNQRSILVLEARDRVGGRTLSVPLPDGSGSASVVDLGAAWIWPSENPEMDRILRALDIARISEGDGAFRVEGGAQSICNRLVESLARSEGVSIRLGCAATSVSKSPEGKSSSVVRVEYRESSGRKEIAEVDAVFVACPPRLVLERISFQPQLGGDLLAAMDSCRTWMAQQGKFVASYPSAFWRNRRDRLYWSRPNADGPLDVVFEHGTSLWGFMSHEKRWRSLDASERERAALHQLSAIVGKGAMSPIAVREQDWAQEMETCCVKDVKEPHPWQHPRYANAGVFEGGHWGSSLWFIGSETSRTGTAGFMEGAVVAAQRGVQQYLMVRPPEP